MAKTYKIETCGENKDKWRIVLSVKQEREAETKRRNIS